MMVVMVVVIFIQIFARFVLNTGFSWPEELARFLFVWSVFLGACVGVYRGAHLGIEALTKHFSPANQRRAALLCHLLCLVLFAHLFVYGLKILPIVGRQISPGLGLSLAWHYSAIIVAGGVMFLHSAAIMARILTDKEEGRS